MIIDLNLLIFRCYLFKEQKNEENCLDIYMTTRVNNCCNGLTSKTKILLKRMSFASEHIRNNVFTYDGKSDPIASKAQ